MQNPCILQDLEYFAQIFSSLKLQIGKQLDENNDDYRSEHLSSEQRTSSRKYFVHTNKKHTPPPYKKQTSHVIPSVSQEKIVLKPSIPAADLKKVISSKLDEIKTKQKQTNQCNSYSRKEGDKLPRSELRKAAIARNQASSSPNTNSKFELSGKSVVVPTPPLEKKDITLKVQDLLEKKMQLQNFKKATTEPTTKLSENISWSNALARAQGTKILNDPEVLKKKLKRKQQKKEKSAREWKARLENQAITKKKDKRPGFEGANFPKKLKSIR